MASTTDEAQTGKAFYGYLFTKVTGRPIPAPTPVLDALLRAIAFHIKNEIGDKKDMYLTPTKLAAFYKIAGHDWDSFFVDMPHVAISTVYQGLGCQHLLLPGEDDFAAPSIPALTEKGFVHWQTIQTLLGPQTQVPVLQFAAAHWSLKHPDSGAPLPADLPKESFPSETDPDTDRWHEECAHKSRMKAAAEETTELPKEAPKEAPKPDFADRKVPYRNVRVSPTTPRDYFTSRPVNVSYVHVASPRPPPPGRSPERERPRAREHYVRRQTTSTEEPVPRRRSFSDYPHSPQKVHPVRVPRRVPERSPHRRPHNKSRRYSTSSESDSSPVSPRTTPRRVVRSNEPPPISVRRVYTGSSEESPRVIRTTMPPPPIPASHLHTPRPSEGGRSTPRDDDSKRRSALSDLKERLSSFIGPAIGAERARSASGSRGRRDMLGSSPRVSRSDILPNSRLSQSWSDIDTDDSDLEEESRRRSRRPSHESRSHHHRDREKEREREKDRERDRERERERERDRVVRSRDRGRDHPIRSHERERDRASSHSDRDHERRDGPVPSPSPAAAAAAATLHRERRRPGSSEDSSPRSWAHGPYLADAVEGGHHRRTSSHPELDRLARRRDCIQRELRDGERDHRDRERERELRDRDSRIRDRGRERDRERDRERLSRDDGERWGRMEERLSRERERERERRDRDMERMPSPALSTGVGGRKYPDPMAEGLRHF